MKWTIAIIFALSLLTGCEDVQDSSPELQASLDFDLFNSIGTRAAENEDGSYLIQGLTQNETLTMKVPSLEMGTYQFGGASESYATFENSNGDTYITNPDGDGWVTISSWDVPAGTVSGTFRFGAIRTGVDTLRVSNGLFYKVPITSFVELTDDPDPDPDPDPSAGIFVSRIDGIPFHPFEVSAVEAGGSIYITGASTSKSILIKLPLNIQIGDVSIPEPGYIVRYSDSNGEEDALTGSIIIIQHLPSVKRIKGTFSFQTATKSISLGQFNVFYD